ncbi:MAG TPA: protein-disulfide reductase DsbD N-terminal domain-containing protein [Burkholderiales bacterium]|nr:protein-disulfide reductase DsbD N-terminal domain-containing protein [Burkholderiales bacterium]
MKGVTSLVRRLVQSAVLAGMLASLPARAADDLLDPEQAFRLSAKVVSPGLIEVRYQIAEGYYLYKSKFRFSAEPTARTGEPTYPAAQWHEDDFFGRSEIYRNEVVISLPLVMTTGAINLVAVSQGCADIGVCFLPQKQTVRLAPMSDGSAQPK